MSNLHAALRRIELMARREMERNRTPALSLAITDREQAIHLATFGYADVESGTPLRPDHLFEFGSIGKSFTAIVLLQLAEEGRLDLHSPVSRYLPWFEVRSEHAPFTLHHLLSHTAGIIRGTDFPADPRFEVWALRNTCTSMPPGEHFHYSNVGYKTLGLVIEQVTGQSYAEAIRERILDPLGMARTEPAITHATRARLAHGYMPLYDDRPWRPEHGYAPATWFETNTADGCIAATPLELATYMRMLMNGGRGAEAQILSADAYKAMTSVHADPKESSSGCDRYGYGLALRYDGERLVNIGHGGGMVGYWAEMMADLDSGFGIVTMTTGRFDQEALASYALEALSATAAGCELPPLPEQPERMTVTDAAAYAGDYLSTGSRVSIAASGDRLTLRYDGREAPLEPHGDGGFLIHDERFQLFPLHAERDEGGAVIALHHGSESWSRPGHEQPAAGGDAEWAAFAGHYRCHNPWMTNFRVVSRGGELLLVYPGGAEEKLLPLGGACFRVGSDDSPETLSFDTLVDGEAWRANYSGCCFYRFFTP